MANAAQILAGSPAQIAMYDATNDTLFLGYLASDNFELTQKPLVHKDIEGMEYQYGVRSELTVELLETDPTKIAALATRRVLKQDIYIVGAQFLIKMHDVYVQHAQKRSYTPGDNSVIEITAKTDVEANVEVIKNLLSSVKDSVDYGNFDIDTNTDGLSDGWTELANPATSRNTPSFLGAGYGADQEYYTTGAADEGIYCDIICPLDQVPVKMTASIYMKYDANDDKDVYLAIKTKNSALTIRDTNTSTVKIITASSVRYSYTVEFTPSNSDIYKVSMYVYSLNTETCNALLDNAQLEFGKLTDYTEND